MTNKNIIFTNNDLKGNGFEDAIFENCKFVGEIQFVNFSNCTFKNCDFSQGLYNIVSLFNCSFPESKLSNIDFRDINIRLL